jgi:hypothetical protein
MARAHCKAPQLSKAGGERAICKANRLWLVKKADSLSPSAVHGPCRSTFVLRTILVAANCMHEDLTEWGVALRQGVLLTPPLYCCLTKQNASQDACVTENVFAP